MTAARPPRPSGPAVAAEPPSRRAVPMPPDQRRAALVTATLGLIREHGVNVSTRQIAEAAGVAEGTIFRVFPNKDALIEAAVEAAFDPGPALAQLAQIDPDQPLRDRLVHAVEQFQQRFREVFQLLSALGMSRPPDHDEQTGRSRPRPPHTVPNAAILAALVELIGADRDQLRVPPEDLCRYLRLLTFSGSHPLITDNRLLSPEEIVDVLLVGALATHPVAIPAVPTHPRGD